MFGETKLVTPEQEVEEEILESKKTGLDLFIPIEKLKVIQLNKKSVTQQFTVIEHPIVKTRMETYPAEVLAYTGNFSK